MYVFIAFLLLLNVFCSITVTFQMRLIYDGTEQNPFYFSYF